MTADIISGFPGAGKTTLIHCLIQKFYKEKKVCILGNRPGDSRPASDLSQSTLNSHRISQKNISAGCLCCSGSRQLESMLSDLTKEQAFEHLFLEASGTSRLSDLLSLTEPYVQEGTLVLSHSVLVLDASDFDNRMLLSQQFFVRQILSAPLFYLTKTERLTEPALETIRNRILALQPNGIFLQEPFADWEALSGRKPRTYSIPISSFSAASKSPSLRRY